VNVQIPVFGVEFPGCVIERGSYPNVEGVVIALADSLLASREKFSCREFLVGMGL
jgi:hypothetical protein